MNTVRIVLWSVVVAVLLGGADTVLTATARHQDVQALERSAPQETSYMRKALTEGHPVREHAWIPLDAIAPAAACAIVLAEDEEFFRNGTLNWQAQRAMLLRIAKGDFSRGGSGIAQQLARNLYLGPNRTPRRKLREYALALDLVRTLPKRRILEVYVNVAEWGDGIWGIEAASQHYFGVPARALTPAQSIVLASMLPAPRRGVPYAISDSAHRRQQTITRKVWRTRLLNDQDFRETGERLREWRKHTRDGRTAREGWDATHDLMGPETPISIGDAMSQMASIATWCDVRRRGL